MVYTVHILDCLLLVGKILALYANGYHTFRFVYNVVPVLFPLN
jgi:hypothetical protein